MKYAYTTIFVNDIEKSIEFYKNLIGLKIINRMEVHSQQLVFLGLGETKIELICDGQRREIPEDISISMGFESDDIEQNIQVLKDAGYLPITDIIKPSKYVRFIFFKDPDGYRVQLVEHS